ncbi:MAG: NAD-dependent dehydratase [Dehalococcoidia bacterium]|nr:NAD-dependent dehydratase [Dehalococcoidia bacterium]
MASPSSTQPRPIVLVTGASGYIASQLLPSLRQRYELRLVDVKEEDREGRRVDGVVLHDLRDPDLEQHRSLFQGVHAVVHLAFNRSASSDSATYYDERTNLDLAYHVYQLALEEGVQRVVVASSNHAADWYEPLIHAREKDVVLPEERPLAVGFYGWAKATYEHLGFLYAQGAYGRKLEVVQIRIGAPRELSESDHEGRPAVLKRNLGAYISPRDLAQLFNKSLQADHIEDKHGIPFQVFYGISHNTRSFWSIANAREVIGYAPEDDSEQKYGDLIARILARSPGKVGHRAE